MVFVSVNSRESDPDVALRIAQHNCFLRGLVGSTVHGLANPGTDDRDEMGVCVEPPEYVLGLQEFDHCVARTQPEGLPSGPGDVDLTIYGLRKFVRLAAKGSPTVSLLFFVRGDDILQSSALGSQLQALAPAFLSARTAQAFLGYLNAQARGLRGERHATRTRELSMAHGYDTKYAMHAMRIGLQGVELLETGVISLPVKEPHRARLREVRAGTVPLNEVLAEIDDLAVALDGARKHADLRPMPDFNQINEFLVAAHQQWWTQDS